MNTIELSISLETVKKDAKKWLDIIRYHESGVIMQLQNDCQFRIPSLIKNKKLLKSTLGPFYRKYCLIYIKLNEGLLSQKINQAVRDECVKHKINCDNSQDTDELLVLLEQKGYEVGIFISHLRTFMQSSSMQQELSNLERLMRQFKNLSIIIFPDFNLLSLEYRELVQYCSSLFSNILYYPLYNKEDCLYFLEHNCQLWKMKLSTDIKNQMVRQSGGYIWLLRQILRDARDAKKPTMDSILHSELLTTKIEYIWNKFFDDEKQLLKKVYYRSITMQDQELPAYQYLLHIGVIHMFGNQVSLTIPCLEQMIVKEKSLDDLRMYEGELFFNNKNVSLSFTRSELHLLKACIENRGQLLTREQIAEALWGTQWDEKYSDWAIDRMLFRLRQKFVSLNINPKLIKTIKTRGVMFG